MDCKEQPVRSQSSSPVEYVDAQMSSSRPSLDDPRRSMQRAPGSGSPETAFDYLIPRMSSPSSAEAPTGCGSGIKSSPTLPTSEDEAAPAHQQQQQQPPSRHRRRPERPQRRDMDNALNIFSSAVQDRPVEFTGTITACGTCCTGNTDSCQVAPVEPEQPSDPFTDEYYHRVFGRAMRARQENLRETQDEPPEEEDRLPGGGKRKKLPRVRM